MKVEVELAKASNDLEIHNCNVEGYDHKPLTKLKISYGNWIFKFVLFIHMSFYTFILCINYYITYC